MIDGIEDATRQINSAAMERDAMTRGALEVSREAMDSADIRVISAVALLVADYGAMRPEAER